jgi:membrane-associated phospholipid phosphatase
MPTGCGAESRSRPRAHGHARTPRVIDRAESCGPGASPRRASAYHGSVRLLAASAAMMTLVAGIAAARPAHAEPWYRGDAGKRRLTHLAFTALGGALYGASELDKAALAPDQCRWCSVDALDDRARNALRWDHTDRAITLSNVTVVATPVLMVGLTALAASSAAGDDHDHLARFIDDAIPIVEAFVGSGLVDQAVKFTVGRQRPYAHFQTAPGAAASSDDNLSFFSGHASLTFSFAVSAGVVAHRRGSPLEPVIWATGLTLATTTSYFRVAGDKHYLTDVLVGAAWGTTAGLVIPRLTHALPPSVTVVPEGTGVAVLGSF